VPLSAQEKGEKFKVFMVDVGICARILGLRLSDMLTADKRMNHLAAGALAEQFVAQELVSMTVPNHRPSLHYWHREAKSSQAEVDFVCEQGSRIYPIEVKSATGGAMKSLHMFLSEKEAHAPYGIKVSQAQWGLQDQIYSIPFYALRHLVNYSV